MFHLFAKQLQREISSTALPLKRKKPISMASSLASFQRIFIDEDIEVENIKCSLMMIISEIKQKFVVFIVNVVVIVDCRVLHVKERR